MKQTEYGILEYLLVVIIKQTSDSGEQYRSIGVTTFVYRFC